MDHPADITAKLYQGGKGRYGGSAGVAGRVFQWMIVLGKNVKL